MTESWRRYDAAQLEAQYNNRRRVPDHPAVIARWQAVSRRVAADHARAQLDLAYGDSPGQTLDWFPTPQGAAAAPLHVFVHGGYWQSLDKADFSLIAPGFNAAGVHCALLNYDLCPRVDLDTIIGQVRRALAWLRRRSEHFRIDPQRIQIGGHSAGAQLAAMAMCSDWAALGPDLPPKWLHSVVAVSGVYQLAPLLATSVNELVRLDAEMADRNSPMLLTPRDPARLLIAVGTEESAEFLRQSRTLQRCWSALAPTLLELPERNHFTVVDALADGAGPLLRASLELLREPPAD